MKKSLIALTVAGLALTGACRSDEDRAYIQESCSHLAPGAEEGTTEGEEAGFLVMKGVAQTENEARAILKEEC
jgi:hypothetical protein